MLPRWGDVSKRAEKAAGRPPAPVSLWVRLLLAAILVVALGSVPHARSLVHAPAPENSPLGFERNSAALTVGAERSQALESPWEGALPFSGTASDSAYATRGLDLAGGAGRLGGELYPASRLPVLERFLARRGITLQVGDEFVPAHAAGAFDSAGGRILLRSNPTKYEVWHELSHWIQFRRIGPDAYRALPRWAREQFVFDMLENNSARWMSLSSPQRQHAVDYILSVGGIR
jgi:Metallopeptidase toxin 4